MNVSYGTWLWFDTKLAWRGTQPLYWWAMIKRNDEKWVISLPGNEDVGVFFGGIVWLIQGVDCCFRPRRSSRLWESGVRRCRARFMAARST